MPAYNTIAVVIRRLNYSETDKILTLYSRDHGRFSAIAKGARKTVSRLSGATELLTCTKFNLASGKSMDVVTQTEVSESFTHLRQDLARLAHGLYLADLVDHVVEDHDPNPILFDLLLTGLTLVQDAASPEVAARWFELQLLLDLGYLPNLYECFACRQPLNLLHSDAGNEETYALSASQGSAVCPYHAGARFRDDYSSISTRALRLLQNLEKIPASDSGLVTAIPEIDARGMDQANMALRRYLRFRMERDLKSISFLDSLRHAAA